MDKSIKNLSSVTIVGLDIAKNVFQVHGVDAGGASVIAKAVRRGQLLSFFASLPPCVVGNRSVQFGASLGALADRTRPSGEVDPAGVCEAVCQAQQERCGRRGGSHFAGKRSTPIYAPRCRPASCPATRS